MTSPPAPAEHGSEHVVAEQVDRLLTAARAHHEEADVELIGEAAFWARQMHAGSLRRSGDPNVSHALDVALLVAEWGMEEDAIVAAVLHDVVADTDATIKEVFDRFGPTVADLVEGLTRLDGMRLGEFAVNDSAPTIFAKHKLLLDLAGDVRVLLIKLADRLHNMRTIDALEPERAVRVASETADVYVSLARRCGFARLVVELENACFRVLHPEQYQTLLSEVQEREDNSEAWAKRMVAELEECLEAEGLSGEVSWRRKGLWSVQKKTDAKKIAVGELHDLIGTRIVVADRDSCYTTLAAVHAYFDPVERRMKDYIQRPRSGIYQSIHTTVIGPDGHPVEVQIRSVEMHEIAEYGIAAHWRYKELRQKSGQGLPAAGLGGPPGLSDTSSVGEAATFVERLRAELVGEGGFVVCFTPRGDIVTLPPGATPVDFAYAVHSDVGDACDGARVDGRQVNLSTQLKSGDRVEITTGRKGGPNPDWLSFVVSNRAIQRIRRAIATDPVQSETAEPQPRGKTEQVAATDALKPPDEPKTTRRARALRVIQRPRRSGSDEILVDGVPGLATRVAKCCSPVHGERLVGWASGGARRAVVVHSAECAGIRERYEIDPGLPVEWATSTGESTAIFIVEAGNRKGLLADQASAISHQGGDIISTETVTLRPTDTAEARFEVEVADVEMADRIIRALRDVPGVLSVRRAST